MECPKCHEMIPDPLFAQHAVEKHGAPKEIIDGTLAPLSLKPPGAQAIPFVSPQVIEEQQRKEEERYQPVGNPHDRPRSVSEMDVSPDGMLSLAVAPTGKPLELTYHYIGDCPSCHTPSITTTLLKIKGVTFAAALCTSCKSVQSTREVKPL